MSMMKRILNPKFNKRRREALLLGFCDREEIEKKTNKMQQSDVYYQLLSEHVSGISQNTSLLTPFEQFFIQAFHKSGSFVSEQTPRDPHPPPPPALKPPPPPPPT